ncbi:hypothetical protein RB653_007557 [Dictyostelium firmibasis]|uniref:ABC transporter domain-containing protein n=1 Tax=Dictyostelium firmibasis TaxID=79012 RepID=A0AAN7TNT0_9MYCE
MADVFPDVIEEKIQDDDKFFGQTRLKNDDIDFNDPENVLTMKNIHKTYLLGIEGVPALRGVSMQIKRGEFICIFGTSGGGKTTMLNIIGTIDKPTKGEMKLCGKTINHKTTDKDLAFLRLRNIGFVFQTFNLLSSLTALENVEMPMILLGELSARERRERAISLLTKVGMKDRLDHFPSQLSGGEQQRVTIARAIANNPDVLLLDEPTGDLDTVNTSVIMKLLTDLNKQENITLIMVTHDVGLKMYSDRIIWMRDGKIQRIETVQEQSKREHYQKLYKECELINQNQKNGVTSVFKNDDDNKNIKKQGTLTEFRRPTDYKSIASYSNNNTNLNNNNNNGNNNRNYASSSSSVSNGKSSQSTVNNSSIYNPNNDSPFFNATNNTNSHNNNNSNNNNSNNSNNNNNTKSSNSNVNNNLFDIPSSSSSYSKNNSLIDDIYLDINEGESSSFSNNDNFKSVDQITNDLSRIL